MRRSSKWKVFAALMAASAGAVARAATVTGSAAALSSGGSATLSSDGYLGTYLVVPSGGATVNFSINATENSGSGAAPHMNLVIADSTTGFSVNSTSASNYSTANMTLPAGTYVVRDERDYSNNIGVTRALTVNSIAVNTVSGNAVTFSNTSTDTNALAAANTYITNYRQGPASVALKGPNNIPLLAGTPIQVNMARNTFNFGGTASGVSNNDSKDMLSSNPATGIEANQFQQFINANFNALVPSNAAKWGSEEPGSTQPANPTTTLVDKQLNYAQSHQMGMRMHNMLWGNQLPTWASTLVTNALAGDTTAKANLSTAITNRVGYYVGTNGNRSLKYTEVDVLNEAQHNPPFWNIYGPSGVAAIYKQVDDAIAATGSSSKAYVNEYNVLQFSPASIDSSGAQTGSDSYANWYRNQVESVNNAGWSAGYNENVVTGIGMQLYASTSPVPSPATMNKALQNLSVEHLPLSLTEFGLGSSTNSQTLGPGILANAMTMMYGTPGATTFMIWGWWDTSGNTPPAQLIITTPGASTYTLTAMGQEWVTLMNQFGTNLSTTVDSTGKINFTGYYGNYYLSGQGVGTLGAKVLPFDFNLTKGTTNYNTTVNKPTNWFFWKTNGSGTWGTASNWTDSADDAQATNGIATSAPTTAGYTAYFGSSATTYNSSGTATTTNITTPLTVTLAAPVTMGMLVFDSASAYTISGSAINLQGYNNANGHVAGIYVNNGSHTINAPLTLLDNTTVTVGPALSTLLTSGIQSISAGLTKAGSGTLTLGGANALGGDITISAGTLALSSGSLSAPNITVNVNSALHYDGGTLAPTNLMVNGGQVSVAAGGTRLMTLNKLAIAGSQGTWSGRVDLNDNDLIIHNGVLSDITDQVKSGFNAAGGYWNGSNGIVSLSAAADGSFLTALGSRQSDGTMFDNLNTTAADVLVKYTYYGDADLNGSVDGADYQQIDMGFGLSLTGWQNGDFNYDGVVNGADYALIDNTFNQTAALALTPLALRATPTGVIAVPEPREGILLSLAAGALAVGRWRRRQTS